MNVKKIASSAKPNYMTNSELDQLEEEVSNQGNLNGSSSQIEGSAPDQHLLSLGQGNSEIPMGSVQHTKPTSSMSGRRYASPNKGGGRSALGLHKNSTGAHGASAEREPCKRCIENAKKQRANALKKKKQQS